MRSGYKQTHKAVERNVNKDDVTKRYPICHKWSSSKEKQLAVVQHLDEDDVAKRYTIDSQGRQQQTI